MCGKEEFVVLSCSGASDLGHLSDIIARRLAQNGVRKMNCLAVAGAGIRKSINKFKNKNLLVIDGCPIDCGNKIIQKCGMKDFKHLRITDFGYQKGKTEITEDTINNVYKKAEVIY